ncbi:MAG: hypothetical protein IPJ41_06775 [Phycisphaerales bacterium]|nr:hypothetical protein [Phycisphaerales bacterium]
MLGGAPSASAQSACDAKVFFFSEYGDNDIDYDNTPGSVDLASSYVFPSCLGSGTQDTDNFNSPANSKYFYTLMGYDAFNPNDVSYAVFRFDVLFQQRDAYLNDSIAFLDDNTCTGVGYQYVIPLQSRLVQLGQLRQQWVSINIDLKSGKVYASEIDDFGIPIGGNNYGEIDTLPAGTPATIRSAAPDGDLDGYFQDDLRVSYVSLMGLAGVPSTTRYYCPCSFPNILNGHYDSGTEASLCSSDDQYYQVTSVKSAKNRQTVEWYTDICGIPTSGSFCDFAVEIEGNCGIKSYKINVFLLNKNGSYDLVGVAQFNKGPDTFTSFSISNPSQYITPSGTVRAKVKMERNTFVNFHVATDVLRIKTKTTP